MRRRCAVPPDATVLAVTRAEQPIHDRPELAARFVAVLGRARERSPIDLHGAALFADHWRAVITARDGYLLAEFLRQVNRKSARAVIALGLDGWAAPIWHRTTELTVLRDDAAAGRALHDLIRRVATCVPIASIVDDRALIAQPAAFDQPPTLLLETDQSRG
jgi:hypothetical protein